MNLATLAYKMKKMKAYEVKFTLLTDSDTASSVKHLIEILEDEVKLQGINYSIKNIKVKKSREIRKTRKKGKRGKW